MAGPSDMGTLGSFTFSGVVAVGTTSLTILQDQKRMLYTITNTSTGGQTITLNMGHIAIANIGIVLSPGQSWVDSNSEGYECYQGPIQAIASAAAGQVSISAR